jgi:hypothetical protein
VLINLAGRYHAPAADVEQALMFAARRPLSGAGDATAEIAGRIRGLLQEQGEKERRRAAHLARYAATADVLPAAAPPPFEERPDLEGALERLDRRTRTALLGALALGCDHRELAALLKTSPATARKRLERAKVAAREEIARGAPKSRHTPRRKPS